MVKCIIYDNEEIKYYVGELEEIVIENEITELIDTTGLLEHNKSFIQGRPIDKIKLLNLHLGEITTIELDPNLMKKIAEYNQNKEFEKLNENVKQKKKEIKRLNEKIKELDDRVAELRKTEKELEEPLKKITELLVEKTGYTIEDDDYDYDYDLDY